MEETIFDKSRPGQPGLQLPETGVPELPLDELLPGVDLRRLPPGLPEVGEPAVVRHYTRLSRLNHSVDTGFYPLGSCTMKYNPKIDDELAALPGFTELHPYQDEAEVQGVLEVMWELEHALLQITGMQRATLQPSAGAHGELTGILMIKAYHAEHGDAARDTVVVPDSAHGTNLASAAMAGYRVVEISSSSRGLIDVDVAPEGALRADRGVDADQSEHAGSLRRRDPHHLPTGARSRCALLLRWGQSECHHGARAPG